MKNIYELINMMIEWIDKLFCSLNVSFENAFAVKEQKLGCLKKHGLVERYVVLLYQWFLYDYCFFSNYQHN